MRSVRRNVAAKAGNVADAWYSKIMDNPKLCTASDFMGFLKIASMGIEESQQKKLSPNTTHITAIQFDENSGREKVAFREVSGEEKVSEEEPSDEED